MKKVLQFTTFAAGIILLCASFLFSQETILWTDDFSDGDFTNNWVWAVTVGNGKVENGEFILSGAPPYNDAWALTFGDTNNLRPGNQYAIYYTTRIEGSGTPASVMNFKDDGTVYWVVDIYPANGAIYLLRGEYPAAAAYIKWVAALTKIQLGQNMKVCIKVIGDTCKVKLWTGPFEPATWDLEYDSTSTPTENLWPGLYIGGWWLDNAKIVYDDFKVVSYLPTVVEERNLDPIAKSYLLSQNYPNPFNSSTTIGFSIPQAQNVKLAIYNIKGERVRSLIAGLLKQGAYSFNWDGKNDKGDLLPSGIFLYKLETENFTETKRMLFLK